MADKGYLITGNKSECLGCEACVQVCAHATLVMKEDSEGFRYPVLDKEACVDCGLCHRVCPIEQPVEKNNTAQKGFGGYALDEETRCASTSGGAFSCIVESWCKENYVVFGAVADGLDVYHTYVTDKNGIGVFRKSKYLQSRIGKSYREAAEFLKEGKYVLFSGTPCQIAGLYNYLLARKNDVSRLLTVEVVCEGVPTPLYVRKLDDGMMEKYGSRISDLDYRFKDGKFDYNAEKQGVRRKGKWDFQVMRVVLENGKKLKKTDGLIRSGAYGSIILSTDLHAMNVRMPQEKGCRISHWEIYGVFTFIVRNYMEKTVEHRYWCRIQKKESLQCRKPKSICMDIASTWTMW